MGSLGLLMCFLNLLGGWLVTIGTVVPWTVAPELSRLLGFHMLYTIAIDLLHVFHLGIARDLLGTALKLLIRDKDFFPGRTIQLRMKSASLSVQRFAKDNGLQLRLKNLSHKRLQWEQYPMLRCKGSDCMVYLAWLAWLVQQPGNERCPKLSTCLWASHGCVNIFHRGGIFLTSAEANEAHRLGMLYLNTYIFLAELALRENKKFYKIRPKLHLFHHIILDMQTRKSLRNPFNDSCWADEDMIGRMMRITSKTHVVTSALRSLQRYLLQLPRKLASYVY